MYVYIYIIVYISLAYFLCPFDIGWFRTKGEASRVFTGPKQTRPPGGLEQTIIKNNELALFHEGNVLESLRLECRKGRKKGGGGKEGRERERELRG